VKYLEDLVRPHAYWDKRPTLRDDIEQQWGNVEGKREVKDVIKEPLPLPKQELYWEDMDITNEGMLEDVLAPPRSSTPCSPTTTWRTTTIPTVSTTPETSCGGHSLPRGSASTGSWACATRIRSWWRR
jgi:hypothetical protein